MEPPFPMGIMRIERGVMPMKGLLGIFPPEE